MTSVVASLSAEPAPVSRSQRGSMKADDGAFGALVEAVPSDASSGKKSEPDNALPLRGWTILHPALDALAKADTPAPDKASDLTGEAVAAEDEEAIVIDVAPDLRAGLTQPARGATEPAITISAPTPAASAAITRRDGGELRVITAAPPATAIDPSTNSPAPAVVEKVSTIVASVGPVAIAVSSKGATPAVGVGSKNDKGALLDNDGNQPMLGEVLSAKKQSIATPAVNQFGASNEQPAAQNTPSSEAEAPAREPLAGINAAPLQTGNTASTVPTPMPGITPLALDPAAQPALIEAARQVTEADLSQLTPDKTTETLKLQLKPVNLGAVTATLHSVNGVLSITLQVETAEAQQRLTHEKDVNGKAIRDLGFDVPTITVQQTVSAAQPTGRDHNGSFNNNSAAGDGAGARNAGNEAERQGTNNRGSDQRAGHESERNRSSAASPAAERIQPGRYI